MVALQGVRIIAQEMIMIPTLCLLLMATTSIEISGIHNAATLVLWAIEPVTIKCPAKQWGVLTRDINRKATRLSQFWRSRWTRVGVIIPTAAKVAQAAVVHPGLGVHRVHPAVVALGRLPRRQSLAQLCGDPVERHPVHEHPNRAEHWRGFCELLET